MTKSPQCWRCMNCIELQQHACSSSFCLNNKHYFFAFKAEPNKTKRLKHIPHPPLVVYEAIPLNKWLTSCVFTNSAVQVQAPRFSWLLATAHQAPPLLYCGALAPAKSLAGSDFRIWKSSHFVFAHGEASRYKPKQGTDWKIHNVTVQKTWHSSKTTNTPNKQGCFFFFFFRVLPLLAQNQLNLSAGPSDFVDLPHPWFAVRAGLSTLATHIKRQLHQKHNQYIKRYRYNIHNIICQKNLQETP